MSLTAATKKQYRAIGHNLNPIIMVADKGLSDGVIEETNRALTDHELIKVKFAINDRVARQQMITDMAQQVGAEVVQVIGKIALIFKKADKPNPALSNLLRMQG